jgi:hypothetical protein
VAFAALVPAQVFFLPAGRPVPPSAAPPCRRRAGGSAAVPDAVLGEEHQCAFWDPLTADGA